MYIRKVIEQSSILFDLVFVARSRVLAVVLLKTYRRLTGDVPRYRNLFRSCLPI